MSAEPERPPADDPPTAPADPHRAALATAVMAMLGALLTGWLAWTFPAWPARADGGIAYLLLAPFLLVPPAWAVAGILAGARRLQAAAATGAGVMGIRSLLVLAGAVFAISAPRFLTGFARLFGIA
jgi:hypothetical protein